MASKLKAHHHLGLHILHTSLCILTVFFLILGGITGPSTGFWWLKIDYSDDTIGSWSIGGLGGCRKGARCTAGEELPPLGGMAVSALRWHFGAAAVFVLLTILTLLLIFFPTPKVPDIPWYTLLLPPFNVFVVVITLIVDIAVAQSIKASNQVTSINIQASFWLIILALVSSLAWCGVAEYIRFLGLKPETKDEEEPAEDKGKGGILNRLWPWS